MGDRDWTGSVAAAIALALMIGAWLWNPLPGGIRDGAGLELASRQALELLPAGQPMQWQDGGTGTMATITPARAYRDGGDRWCRPYALVLTSAGKDYPTRHIACRDEAGHWTNVRDKDVANTNFDRWFNRLSRPEGQLVAALR